MSKPIRVQIRRIKGWRMPPNTVWVARPGRWGNPWRVQPGRTIEQAIAKYRSWLNGEMPSYLPPPYRMEDLRGKNLACFCKLTDPCHADVLLEIANAPEPPHA